MDEEGKGTVDQSKDEGDVRAPGQKREPSLDSLCVERPSWASAGAEKCNEGSEIEEKVEQGKMKTERWLTARFEWWHSTRVRMGMSMDEGSWDTGDDVFWA